MITNIWQPLAFQFFSASLSSIRSRCDERLSWAEEDTMGDWNVSVSSKSPDSVASSRAGSFACLISVVFLISSLTIEPLDLLHTCLCASVGGSQRLTLGVCLPLLLCILFLWDRVFLQTETVTAVGVYPVSSFTQQWCHSSLYFPLWFFDIR